MLVLSGIRVVAAWEIAYVGLQSRIGLVTDTNGSSNYCYQTVS